MSSNLGLRFVSVLLSFYCMLTQPIASAYSVSQKNPPPPEIFWHFSQTGQFFVQILYACYVFLPTLDYKFLFNYLQL